MPTLMDRDSSQPAGRKTRRTRSPSDETGGRDPLERIFLSSSWLSQDTLVRRRASRLSLEALLGFLCALIAVSVAIWTAGTVRLIFSITSVCASVGGAAAVVLIAKFRRQRNLD